MTPKPLLKRLTELSSNGEVVLTPDAGAGDSTALLARWAIATAEANDAYENWQGERNLEAYALYRAAADRADAAQDALASHSRRAA